MLVPDSEVSRQLARERQAELTRDRQPAEPDAAGRAAEPEPASAPARPVQVAADPCSSAQPSLVTFVETGTIAGR
jgi:hypothetical protein